MLQIKINGDKIINGSIENGTIVLNGEQQHLDIAALGSNCFHLIKNNISYRAEVLSKDWNKKQLVLKINSEVIQLDLKDRNDLLVEKLGLTATLSSNVTDVKAPMPGLILNILVKEGQQVEQGDTLVILEAMKMENSIKSPIQATVKSIHIKPGESVEKNEVLIRF